MLSRKSNFPKLGLVRDPFEHRRGQPGPNAREAKKKKRNRGERGTYPVTISAQLLTSTVDQRAHRSLFFAMSGLAAGRWHLTSTAATHRSSQSRLIASSANDVLTEGKRTPFEMTGFYARYNSWQWRPRAKPCKKSRDSRCFIPPSHRCLAVATLRSQLDYAFQFILEFNTYVWGI